MMTKDIKELLARVKEQRELRSKWQAEKEEIKKEINKINYILTKKGITKRDINGQWKNWLKYCERNNIDKRTGELL